MLYLSRASLKRDASVAALAPLLLGKSGRGGHTGQPGHHLVWSLFADGPDRQRDFLWREMDTGVFLILSARPPEDRHGLFEIAEPKPFTPTLEPGDPTEILAACQSRTPSSRSRAPPFRQARCGDGRAAVPCQRRSCRSSARRRLGAGPRMARTTERKCRVCVRSEMCAS